MKLLLAVFLFVSIAMMIEAKPQTVQYTLRMTKPSTHLFEVEMSIENIARNETHLDFIMPVWRPGRYLVLDFAGGVQEFSARNNKEDMLSWGKIDKTTWRVDLKGSSTAVVRYKVYANEFSQRTRGLNDEHGFADGTAVFMYVEKFRKLPVTLTICPFGDWHVTTGLDSVEGKPNVFSAPEYDTFVDCPIEIGNQKDFPFDVDGTPHVLSIAGEGNWNADTLIKDISKLVRVTRDLWGKFPYKRFVFLVHCSPSSGGGTEHLNSVIMGIQPFIFKNPDSYRGFLGLVSHEYFHTWNVKQLRPKGIHPYDYMKENYSEELWIAEGTTSYYGQLLLVRSGYQTVLNYLDGIAGAIQSDRQRPGNTVQSLSEASFDAWIKYWRWNQQSFNSESDYYGKGSLVSMLLDLEIRHQSSNTASLDAVLRTMYQRFPLSGSGYTIGDVKAVAEDIAAASFEGFFNTYVFGTDPLPWERTLAYAGLDVALKDTVPKPWIGLAVSDMNGRPTITQVSAGSPAYNAGVDFGDELVALNGFRIRAAVFADRMRELAIGDTVVLNLLHNDKLKTINVVLEAGPLLSYRITKTKNPTALQTSIYEDWLHAKWDEGKK